MNSRIKWIKDQLTGCLDLFINWHCCANLAYDPARDIFVSSLKEWKGLRAN